MAAVTTPRPRFDTGAIAGSIAAAAVLLLWLTVENGFGQGDETEAPEEPAPSAEAFSALGAQPSGSAAELVADPAPIPRLTPVKTQSAKPWQTSIDLGRAGMQQLEEAFRRKEKKGGPFRFQSQSKKATKKLESAIESLDAILAAGSLSTKNSNSIKAWRDHFAKAIHYTRK